MTQPWTKERHEEWKQHFDKYGDETGLVELRLCMAELEAVQGKLERAVKAMKKSMDVGSTDHLDCCDDGGKFWYAVLSENKELLQ